MRIDWGGAMLDRLNWQDLPYFLELARNGTLTGTARAMGVNHATVSRHLDALETALGTRLFQRHARGYTITPPGEALLKSVTAMDEALERGLSSLPGQGAPSGLVRVSALEGLGLYFVGPALGRYCTAQRQVRAEMVLLQQHVSMSRAEAELNISLAPPDSTRFSAEKLTDYSLGLYATRTYLDRAPPLTGPGDLHRHATIGYVDDLILTQELDYLDEVQPGLRPRLQSSSLMAQLDWTRAGLGVCVLPDYIARTHPDLQRLPGTDLCRSYWIFARSDIWSAPRLRFLRRFLIDEAARPGMF